jgi:hypothetical protein
MKPGYRPGPIPLVSATFDSIETTRVRDFLESDDWKKRDVSTFDNHVEHDNVGIFTIKNLGIEIDGSGELELHVPGHVYLVDVNQSFFHALFDNFGQYLALKRYLPDIKPLAMVGDFPYNNLDYLNSHYKTQVLEMCGVSPDEIVHYRMFKKITFEKLSFITTSCNNIMSGIISSMAETNYDLPMDIRWAETTKQVYLFSRELKEFILKRNQEAGKARSRKIFISRKERTETFKKNYDLIKFLEENGVTWEMNNPSLINDPNGIAKTNLDKFKPATPAELLFEARHRYMLESEEKLIENYFAFLGYDIMEVSMMPLEDQMELFSSCTHIATITGAGSLNSMYLENDGVFILIANNSGYTFYHEDVVSSMMDDPIIVFDKRKNPGEFSARQIIKELEQKHLDRL